MTLTVYRGLPGSGKTTAATAWVAERPTERARVNRDDLRAMLHGGYVDSPTEHTVSKVRDALIRTLLERGIAVVSDDTNLRARVVRDLRRVAELAGADFEVIDLTDMDPDVCVARDAARERTVGEKVIRDMHLRFINGQPHPLPIPDEPPTAVPAPYEPKPGAPSAILVDIDGTVALMGSRSPFDETLVHEDRPNLPVIETVRAMEDAGYAIVFMSGRTAACMAETEAWLAEHVGTGIDGLHMRPAGDMRKDAVVKAELFDAHIRDRWNVVAVLDDRRQVVDMWRSMGLTVMQVAEGNF